MTAKSRLAAALASIAATLALAAPAQAVVTASTITAPAAGTVDITQPNHGFTLTITGTTTGTGNVDIRCYEGPASQDYYKNVFSNLTVTANAFSMNVNTNNGGIPNGDCTLRAVPTSTNPTDLSPFPGPKMTFIWQEPLTATSGPSNGALNDYFFGQQESQGYADFLSVSSCGLCDMSLLSDPSNFYNSAYLFYGNAALYDDEQRSSNDRGYAVIDGHNALFSYSASQDAGGDTGQPPLTMTDKYLPNGDLSITEDEDAVRCPTDLLPYGTTTGTNNCPSLIALGVHLHRTILLTDSGTVVQIVDVWSSTNGQSATLDLDYDQYQGFSVGAVYMPSYEFPWVANTYATHALGDTIPGPPSSSAPVSMFVKANSTAADGDPFYPQGSITFDPAPSGFGYHYTGGPDQDFVANFQQTIPAGGAVTIKQTYAMSSTKATLSGLATAAEDQQDTPVVAISTPMSGSTTSASSITVTGTATDRDVASVKVDGVTATVGSGGAFSATVPLSTAGANTITVVATDGAGNQGSSSVIVNYQRPSLKLIGHVRAGAKSVAVNVRCVAQTPTECGVLATLTTTEHRHGPTVIALSARARTRKKVVGVGSRRSTFTGTTTLTIPLNGTGRSLLSSFKTLPVTLLIRLTTVKPSVPVTAKAPIKTKTRRKH